MDEGGPMREYFHIFTMDAFDEVHLEQVLTEDDCSFIFDC